MRRVLFVFVCLLCLTGIKAQSYYRVTGDNVNVRTGPGSGYSVMIEEGFGEAMKIQLFKGQPVKSRGAARNGFVPVTFIYGVSALACYPHNGWVSQKYLRQLTHKCSACNGRGYFNRPCRNFPGSPADHPTACNCHGICFHNNCEGKQHCNACDGLGWK